MKKGKLKTKFAFALGDEAKDKITGFTGVVVARHEYLTGCSRFSLQCRELKDGKIQKSQSFDENQLDSVKSDPVIERGEKKVEFKFAIGEKVRDKITGFIGVVVARADFLSTEAHFSIQCQELNKDGKPFDWEGFPGDSHERVEDAEKVELKETKKVGGPRDEVMQRFD